MQVEPVIVELATICQRGEEYMQFMMAKVSAAAAAAAANGASSNGDSGLSVEAQDAVAKAVTQCEAAIRTGAACQ